jgi:YVTN family beta-propeller protein
MNSPMTNADPASNQQIVVFPPERGIGALAVVPPWPPGFKEQSDGALGVNINMVHSDSDGLLVYILAYLNMAIGDNIEVYIETKNAPVAEFSVTEAHFNAEGKAKDIPFYISTEDMKARFLQSENKPFWFEVERVSGNGTEGSPPVQLFYKHPAPGEADTDGGKDLNQGLKLPVASESVVDQTVIDDGMFVTVREYFNQSIGDVVVLAFGSLLLEFTVTALGDIVFELTPQMLATLRPTNSLVVRWGVFDVVENSSGWSDALFLTSKPGMVLLAAPIFEQADPDNVVHHDSLEDGPMNVLVTGVFAANELIELTLEGLTKGGDQATHTFSVPLAAASRAVKIPVLNEWVRNLIGGSARASYTWTKAGKLQRSKPADATFSGTSLPLGLPIVEPLVDNKLPVDTVSATVQVAEYWPLKKGAIVKLNWQTTDQDGIVTLFIFQRIVTDPAQQIIFQVPAKYIAPYASRPLTVQCTVTNPGEVEVFSELLQLMFGDATQIVLKAPFLVAPATNPIESSLYPEGVKVRVEHLTAQEGDEARLEALNALPGTPAFATVRLNQNKRANFTLSPELLKAHQGRNLRLRWVLIRNGSQTPSPELRLSISASAVTVTFDNAPYTLAPAGRFNVRLALAKNGVDLPDETVELSLPKDFAFSDNVGGSRRFVTDKDGKITVNGVTGHTVPGAYSLTALYGNQTVVGVATVRSQASVGIIPGIPYPYSIAISPDGTRAYIVGYSNTANYGALTVVDTATHQVMGSIALGRNVGRVAVSPDNSRVYITRGDPLNFSLIVVDTTSLDIIRNVPLSGFAPYGVAISPDGSRAYLGGGVYPVTGFPNGGLAVVDTVRFETLQTLVLQNNTTEVAVSPDGSRVYATNANGTGNGGSVSVIDTSTFGVVRNIEVGSNPHSIVVSRDGTRIYTVRLTGSLLVVIDARTHAVIQNVQIGIDAWHLALSPDGKSLCASEWNSGKAIVIVDTTNFSVRRIPVRDPQGVAFSSDSTRVYICNYTDNNVLVEEIEKSNPR